MSIYPFDDLVEVLAYRSQEAVAQNAKTVVEVLKVEFKALIAKQSLKASSGPRCKACGGSSYPAPRQYQGHYHAPGCREVELSDATTAAHKAEMARRAAEEVAIKVINLAISTTELGRLATERGMVIRKDRVDGDTFTIWRDGTGGPVASGSWTAIQGYFAGTHVQAHMLGFD